MLFRLENSNTRAEVDDTLVSLLTLLESPAKASLRRAFSAWVSRVILPRLPGGPLEKVISLQEMRMVLAERFYKLDAKVEAKAKAKGMRDGMRQGIRRGMRHGIRKGKNEGRREGKAEFLLNLLRKRFGKLPRWVAELVQEARAAQLSRWGARLLEVQSLDELFRGRRRISAGMR